MREISAEPENAQARLDKIVVKIAEHFVAEDCSVYVLRADRSLELYAAAGLNRDAVHSTTLAVGEGLVGLAATSAEPLALPDARKHPAFLFKPGTGEEFYHSFLGVPILRGGAMRGVIVVQNKMRRVYSEEEIEALQSTAMLLAEMIASGELQSIHKSPEFLSDAAEKDLDFTDRDTLCKWLITQECVVCVILAGRAALRALPFAVLDFSATDVGRFGTLISTLFRASALARVVAKYPSYYDYPAGLLRAASLATTRARPRTRAAAAAADAGFGAAAAAADVADGLTFDMSPGSLTSSSASTRASTAALRAADATRSAPLTHPAFDESAAAWAALLNDVRFLNGGDSVVALANRPLWPDGNPPKVVDFWSQMKAALPHDEDWDVWSRWYDGRLEGAPSRGEAYELAFATIPLKVWDEGHAAANKWIKKRLDELASSGIVPGQGEAAPHVTGPIPFPVGYTSPPQPDQQIEPPSVPAKRPAAIEPVIRDGKIALPSTPAEGDLESSDLEAALEALRAQIVELAADLEGESNIDKGIVAYLRRLAEKIPRQQPTQAQLFLLAHEQETLKDYSKTVAAEWPQLLAARYLAATLAFDRTARQFPRWRKFKQNADEDRLDDSQRAEVPKRAVDFAAALREEDAKDFVAPEIAATLDDMVQDLNAARDVMREEWVAAGGDTKAEDTITSIENILKLMAEISLHGAQGVGRTAKDTVAGYIEKFGEGAVEQAKKEGKKDGEGLVKWSRRALIAACGIGIAKVPAIGAAIGELMEHYPKLSWLRPIIDFLSNLPS